MSDDPADAGTKKRSARPRRPKGKGKLNSNDFAEEKTERLARAPTIPMGGTRAALTGELPSATPILDPPIKDPLPTIGYDDSFGDTTSESMPKGGENKQFYEFYLTQHLKNACRVTSIMLEGKTEEQQCNIVAAFLEGYLTWLPSQKDRNEFISKLTAKKEGVPMMVIYLRLWRLLFQVCEHIAHCPNRLAQLFHWEIAGGPLFSACSATDPANHRVKFGAEFLDFYQDGIKQMQIGQVNFDDINDVSIHPIQNSELREVRTDPERSKPHRTSSSAEAEARLPGRTKFYKSFREPEGIWAVIVSLRNNFNILQYNLFVTILAWYWAETTEITASIAFWADGASQGAYAVLDIWSRLIVYRMTWCCGYRRLPWRQVLLLVFLVYPTCLAYVPCLAILPEQYHLYVCAVSVVVRIVYNLVLFFRFPHLGQGHRAGGANSCAAKLGLGLRLGCFFVATTAVLVPTNYLFIVPTLQRSAVWTFCDGFTAAHQLQCYLGSIGLWVPLITVVFIVHFVAYNLVMALYGTLVIQGFTSIGLRTAAAPAFAAIKAFRTLTTFISAWSPPETDSSAADKSADPKSDQGTSGERNRSPKSGERSAASSKSGDRSAASSKSSDGSSSSSEARSRAHMGTVRGLWHNIVEDFREMDVISTEGSEKLGTLVNMNDGAISFKAREALLFFLTSLVTLSEDEVAKFASKTDFMGNLPSFTQLIPSYGEAVLFDREYLSNVSNKNITNLEFLVLKYKNEWAHFLQRLIFSYDGVGPIDPFVTSDQLLNLFLHHPGELPTEIEDEIRIWASLRGQTLYRTLRGAITYRKALKLFLEGTTLKDQRSKVNQELQLRYQLILSHQQYGDPTVLKKIGPDMQLIFKKLSQPVIMGFSGFGDNPFDLVFDFNSSEVNKFATELHRANQRVQSYSDPLAHDTATKLVKDLTELDSIARQFNKLIYKASAGVVFPKGEFPNASIRAGLARPVKCYGVHLFNCKSLNPDGTGEWDFQCSGPCVLHITSYGHAVLRIWDVSRKREHSIVLRNLNARPNVSGTAQPQYFVLRASYIPPGELKQRYIALAMKDDNNYYNVLSESHREILAHGLADNSLEALEFEPVDDPEGTYATGVWALQQALASLNPQPKEGGSSESSTSNTSMAPFLADIGLEIYQVLPRRHVLVLPVDNPATPFAERERIQGKSANQFNGLLFCHGLTIQTKDANQGGNLAESMKYPLVITQFTGKKGNWSRIAPAMIGFRESVFTRFHGTVARMQAYSEWAFVTIVQRVLSRVGLRMHYGHPDIFSAPYVYSRAGVSKANSVYHLSEDIFAGYVALLHDKQSTHTDLLQDEKGRDTSLSSTATFTAKIAQGAAAQMKSSDVFELHSRLDYVRQQMLFQSSTGFYIATTLMLVSVRMYMLGLLLFTLAGYSAQNLGNFGLIFSLPFLIQVGSFTLIPLLLESYTDGGFWALLQVVIDVPLSVIYFLFQSQTVSYHFEQSFVRGKSRYEATGRLLGLSRRSLSEIYQLFGRSHLEVAIEYSYYVMAYYIVASSRGGGYVPLIAPILAISVFFIAPWLFQPAMSLRRLKFEVDEFVRWAFASSSAGLMTKDWKRRPMLESIVKRISGSATTKIGFPTLQAYSVFNDLRVELNSHWRVNVAAALGNLTKFALWGFVLLSIPGSMKDLAIQVNLLGFSFVLNSALFTLFLTPKIRGLRRMIANLAWAVVPLSIIFHSFYLDLWGQFWFSVFGLFLHMKLLSALSWMIFHIAAIFIKCHFGCRWRLAHRNTASKSPKPTSESSSKQSETQTEPKKSKAKLIKEGVEQQLLTGLHLVHTLARPFLAVGVFLLVIPTYVVWNLIWLIPHLSEVLMYGIVFRMVKRQRLDESKK